MLPLDSELEAKAASLEATGNYKILRRLSPRMPTPTPDDYSGKIGIILDVETTDLDAAKHEIIELAMVKFRYSDDGQIIGVSDIFQALNEPSAPIPAEIAKLTGITDAVVAGQKIDVWAVEKFIADANIIIAHNANFDRKFAERYCQAFAQKPWVCSFSEIDWKKHGFGGAKLEYLVAGFGLFYEAHRGTDDCHAVLALLSRPLPQTSTTALAVLMEQAGNKSIRV